jgi:hypothetical protein
MKITLEFILSFCLLITFSQCKDKEDPIPPFFNIEATVVSTLTPLPIKSRVVLYSGRNVYNFEKSRNSIGDPNKSILSSIFACFQEELNPNNLATFDNISIEPSVSTSSSSNQIFTYDTIFFRVEAMQLIGSDTVFKTSDANPAFLVLPDSKGNETIQKKITLKIDQ